MSRRPRIIPLLIATPGHWVMIRSVPAGTVHAHFLRVGMNPGTRVKCLERLPGGTVVLQKNRQQIAVGHTLAKKILVAVVEDGDFSS